jgi:hypothetical protein
MLPAAATAATASGVPTGNPRYCCCCWYWDSDDRSNEVLRIGPDVGLELLPNHGDARIEALAALVCSVGDAWLALVQLVVLTVPAAGNSNSSWRSDKLAFQIFIS